METSEYSKVNSIAIEWRYKLIPIDREKGFPCCLPNDLKNSNCILRCRLIPQAAFLRTQEMVKLVLYYETYLREIGEKAQLPYGAKLQSISRSELSGFHLGDIFRGDTVLEIKEEDRVVGYLMSRDIFGELSWVYKEEKVTLPIRWFDRLPKAGSYKEAIVTSFINDVLPHYVTLAMPRTLSLGGQIFLRHLNHREPFSLEELPLFCKVPGLYLPHGLRETFKPKGAIGKLWPMRINTKKWVQAAVNRIHQLNHIPPRQFSNPATL